MTTPALYKVLLQKYAHLRAAFPADTTPSTLVIADESTSAGFIADLAPYSRVFFITNRFDVAEQCRILSAPCLYSDFDFSALETRFDICLYRISKERPLCQHVFNHLHRMLKPKGHLIFVGKKNEGVKGYQQKLNKALGIDCTLEKVKDSYIGVTTLAKHSGVQLDDKNYSQMREITVDNTCFYSKPGVYGWNKVDKGSVFLAEHVLTACQHRAFDSVLDLGCGYGYLAMRLLDATRHNTLKLRQLTATDNNIAAVEACRRNLQRRVPDAVTIHITADDCGKNINERSDLIVCNPPFHQGFDNSRELTHTFLAAARRLLHPQGRAYFVVNVFVPLEELAKSYFSSIETLANNHQFKIIGLGH